MKEKYRYESLKDLEPMDALLFVSLALFIIALIKREALETKVFFTLLAISLVLFSCWIIYLNLQGSFTADDKAVTFGKIFKKRIDYSTIKSIDMSRSTITRRQKRKRYAKLVEWITFHCEDGDHSFACKSEPSQKTITMSNNSEIVSPDDTTYSPFSRLKIYIEDIKKKS